ncbi:MAG: M20/M25/M40 family metallo-hydrolase, partial [Chloroflexi bacterium]
DLVPSGSGETAIAQYVASWMSAAGLDVEIVEPVPGRPSVVGVLRGTGGGRSLMLNAHMDTVGAGGMPDAFSPRVEEERIYGRGAYDMKASLAAIMITAREAARLRLKGDLIITAVADEEVASLGTSAVIERYRADAAIVTEPTELRLCLAHKGFVWLEVETTGVAAHGSRADLGVDAIANMGQVLTGVLDLNERLRSGARHPLLGTGSIHASLIEGGQEMSTYPARCVAKLERRTIPGEKLFPIYGEVHGEAGEWGPLILEGDQVTARVLLERAPSELAPDHPLSQAVAQAAGQPEIIGAAYWMDMALTNAAGIPTVAYGPIGEGAHADVEWVDVASVEKCVDVYLKAAEQLCN